MQLSEIKVSNFRNHERISISFKDRITVVTGENGTGKTSLLEAISILGSARSFRGGRIIDLIKHGTEQSIIEGLVRCELYENSIRAELKSSRKALLLNGKKLRQVRDVMSIMPFVIFSPADHRIVEGDSSDRRSFLNKAVSQWDFTYADDLRSFQRVLLQRNRILKENKGNLGAAQRISTALSPWDEQFIHYSKVLSATRSQYLDEFEPIYSERYRQLANRDNLAGIKYLDSFDAESRKDSETTEEIIKDKLQDSLKEDILRGSTSIGPHKDEISLTIDGNQAKFYGSQGEKRTIALALRLAEVDLIQRQHDKAPMLLVDDVSSELDSGRRQALVELLRKGESQVLITATELPMDLLDGIDLPFDHFDLSRSGEV